MPTPITAGVVASSDAHMRTSGGKTRTASEAAGTSPHTQGGNASLFYGGKSGGHRLAHAPRQGLPHLTDPASLQDQSFGKQTQGTSIQAEQAKKEFEQKKSTLTTSPAA